MRNIVKLILFAFIITNLASCKKGEDDPFLSVRTRKSRVVGDWTVKSGTMVYSYSNQNSSSSDNVTFSGIAYTDVSSSTYNNTTTSVTNTGTFSYKINFVKDGSFKMTQVFDGSTYITNGFWNFTSGIGKLKNKEQIVLNVTSQVDGNSGNTSVFTGNKSTMTFNIRELRNKKMVLTSEDTSVDTGTTNSTKEEYTFEQ